MATFPSVAVVTFEGYTEKPDSAVKRSTNESGPPNQRKTVSRVLVKRSVNIVLKSKADKDTFLAWFRADINYGADWFDFTDPYDSVVRSARFVDGELDPRPLNSDFTHWNIGATIETSSA